MPRGIQIDLSLAAARYALNNIRPRRRIRQPLAYRRRYLPLTLSQSRRRLVRKLPPIQRIALHRNPILHQPALIQQRPNRPAKLLSRRRHVHSRAIPTALQQPLQQPPLPRRPPTAIPLQPRLHPRPPIRRNAHPCPIPMPHRRPPQRILPPQNPPPNQAIHRRQRPIPQRPHKPILLRPGGPAPRDILHYPLLKRRQPLYIRCVSVIRGVRRNIIRQRQQRPSPCPPARRQHRRRRLKRRAYVILAYPLRQPQSRIIQRRILKHDRAHIFRLGDLRRVRQREHNPLHPPCPKRRLYQMPRPQIHPVRHGVTKRPPQPRRRVNRNLSVFHTYPNLLATLPTF